MAVSKCIEWTGARDPNYGNRKVDGVMWKAHRYAWAEANGPIPDGMMVLHSCDNPPCVNVDHLFLGTNMDNLRDASRKGRLRRADHGSSSMYGYHGCRCEPCRQGNIRRKRAWLNKQ